MDQDFKNDSESEPVKIVANAEKFGQLLDQMQSIFIRTDSYLPNTDTYVIFKETDGDRDELIEGLKAASVRKIQTFLILKDGKIISAKGKKILVLSRNDVLQIENMKKKSTN